MKYTTTIEDIKRAALQLLGANLSDDIYGQSIPELIEKDDTYAQYLVNMDASINRAIKRMVQKGVLPDKTYTLEYAESYQDGIAVNGGDMVVSVEKLIDGFRELKRVDFIDRRGNIYQDVDYGVLGDDILLKALQENERYVFTYSYAPAQISPIMALSQQATDWKNAEIAAKNTGEGAYNKNTLDIPDDLASIIPKFVFGELYMHDEPSVAMYQGINPFEAYLSDYKPPESVKNNQIKNIFGVFN
ncbi:MAG: hypothetical protein IJY05_03180 [Clostridia bacterium]|nr:hypothetical protein [Clostridia bacterium]